MFLFQKIGSSIIRGKGFRSYSVLRFLLRAKRRNVTVAVNCISAIAGVGGCFAAFSHFTNTTAKDYLKVFEPNSLKDLFSLFIVNAENIEAEKTTTTGSTSSRRHLYNFIADIVEEITPAVVYIEVITEQPFGTSIRRGSGFIVRSDGIVLTNAHSVEYIGYHQRIDVKLYDGKIYHAELHHIDRQLDLATLKIKANNLSTLPLADSDSARVGEWVIAVGSPFSLSNTVTMGVISNTHRSGRDLMLNKPVDYIQTDAAINEGNSGGPLVNLDGQVVGINTMTLLGGSGISFSIPSKYASVFLKEAFSIEEKSKVGWIGTGKKPPLDARRGAARRSLGVTIMPLDPQISVELRRYMPDFPQISSGLLVHSVTIGSSAYNCGLEPGDIITEVNGHRISKSTDLFEEIDKSSQLQMSIQRGSKKLQISVNLETK